MSEISASASGVDPELTVTSGSFPDANNHFRIAPTLTDGNEIGIGGSAGIGPFSTDGNDAAALMKLADADRVPG